MTIVWWIIGALIVNLVIGAAVWSLVDDESQRYLSWFKSCPARIAFFAQPLVLSAWPVGLWFWYRRGT